MNKTVKSLRGDAHLSSSNTSAHRGIQHHFATLSAHHDDKNDDHATEGWNTPKYSFNTHIHTSKWTDDSYELRAQCTSIIWVTLCLCVAQTLRWDTQMIETYTVYKNTHEHIHIYEHILTVMWFNNYHGVCRGEICHCRHCRRQCKIFANGVNFSIFTLLLCLYH